MKTKVCFLNNYFEFCPGGAEYQTLLYAMLLPKDKFEIFFVMLNNAFKEGELFHDDHKVYIRHQPNSFLLRFGDTHFLSWPAIRTVLDKECPDVVVCLGGYSYIGPVAKYKERTYKFVWICASNMDLRRRPYNMTRPFDLIGDTLRFSGINNAASCYVQSKEQKLAFKKRFKREVGIFRNVQPSLDNETIKQYLRIKIVWVANIKGLKQPELFIELARRCQHLKNVDFIMIGSPNPHLPYQRRIESQMSGLDNFTYMGRQSQDTINQVLNDSHILVNTSTHEGFSNVFVQAWLRGMPVISLNEDPDSLLSRRGLGFYAEGDFEKLHNRLGMLIFDHEMLKEMGKRAKEYATRAHSPEAVLPILMEIVGYSSNDSQTTT